MDHMRIVFMGTPGFAVSSLDALVKSGANIVAVVTAPDKPAGRGLTLKESEVKQYAVSKKIPVLQPEKLKNPEFIQALQDLKPDLAVVVAFRMLPEVIWSMPTKGTINLHASLLPQYRGAAPINWAVINGETRTGVTTFFIEKEIDTGKIIAKREVEITSSDTAGTLHDKLSEVGSALLVETVKAIETDTCTPIPQEHLFGNEDLKPAPKIFRDDCRIDWNKPVTEIYNFIRGLSPYPGAWTMFKMGEDSKTLKILECKPVYSPKKDVATLWSENKNDLNIAAADGYISIQKLQLEGKKAMKADEFLRGIRDLSIHSIE
ncbi:MAG TPA: methionyl-tRNA formyltransferase [Bacteroidales bacterium]|nr:methionyl-tRNA formyltransferase [Bacteroidales bacterium]